MPELATHDQQLAHLLEGLLAQQSPDVEQIAQQHPELADELRQLWATAQLASFCARPATPTPRKPPPPPQALPRAFGDYDLLEELGRGGMGVVYKAWDRRLQRTVALKMVLHGALASPDDLARFRAEAVSAAGLTHEHIVPVFEVGEVEGQPYFSMKYIEGRSLAAEAAEGRESGVSGDPRRIAALLAKVARAVQHAHQHGLLHRDLKPANILLDADRQPHVTDFGLAKRVSAATPLTRTGAILGTPSYMPPEQAAGSRGTLGPAGDVYSLGAILYELLTGRPPFQGPTALDTLLQVLERDPLPPRDLNPRADPELELICLKCLQKPADLRYASAAELADDLEAYLNNEPISARSGHFFAVMGRLFRETHHAAVLENWGVLWMWHSLKLFLLCVVTNVMLWAGVQSRSAYLILWTVGLLAWGAIFWALRRRSGPVTFVERQIAHVWAGSVAGCIGVFAVEALLDYRGVGLPVLALSPVLPIMGGMVFLVKAGTLSGSFYLAALAEFAVIVPMAMFPSVAPLLFGIVSAGCFFVPGLKYHRQRRRASGAA